MKILTHPRCSTDNSNILEPWPLWETMTVLARWRFQRSCENCGNETVPSHFETKRVRGFNETETAINKKCESVQWHNAYISPEWGNPEFDKIGWRVYNTWLNVTRG